jgi:hypothetical protein
MYVFFCSNSFFDELEFLKLIIFFDIGRKAAFGIRAVNRMATLAHAEHDTGKAQMREDIFKYKEESAKVCCCVGLFLLTLFYGTDCFRLIFLGNLGGV